MIPDGECGVLSESSEKVENSEIATHSAAFLSLKGFCGGCKEGCG